MRALVYDQFWPTLGGGEKFAGGIAQVLAQAGHEVTLLAHQSLDLTEVGERLALDLRSVAVEVVDATPDAVSAASAATDLFVNASFMSSARSEAPVSIYVVHFPTIPQLARSPLRRRFAESGRAALRVSEPSVEPTSGLHTPDILRRHSARWTTGLARLAVPVPPGKRMPVSIALGRYADPSLGTVEVVAEVDGEPVGRASLRPVTSRWDLRRVTFLRFNLESRPDGEPVEVALRSPSHRPVDLGLGGDNRTLGVPVVGMEAGGGAARRLAARLPGVLEAPPGLGFLDTYSATVSNSAFTQRWVERLWSRPSGLLHPPVTAYDAGPKAPVILSVGRFFRPGAGHSKKQLDMVEAFGRLHRAGSAPGWSLHLVGGCAAEDRPYLDEVREAAHDLPVKLHVAASGEVLRTMYAEASIYWHATGLGEDEDRHPDRMEHFGITTVEAMSAGAVPVVMAAAGQREVVRDGIDGRWFRDLDGLVAATADLIGDPAGLARLSQSARAAAARFGFDAFEQHVLDLVAGVVPAS